MKVTALICTHNGKSRGFIDGAIESILRQTRPVDEIIIVDDGSTDGTGDYVASLNPNVRVICLQKSGVSAARNAGMIAAAGDVVAFLDDDDLWAEDRIGETIKPYELDPELLNTSIVFTDTIVFFGADPGNGHLVESLPFYASWPSCLLGPVIDGNGGVMLPVILFKRIGMFQLDLVNGEDRDYWHRAILSGVKFLQIKKPLFFYRKSHPSATSATNYDEQILDFVRGQLAYDDRLWGKPILFQLAFAATLRAIPRLDLPLLQRLIREMRKNLTGFSLVAMFYRLFSLIFSSSKKFKNRFRELEANAVLNRCKSKIKC